MVWCCLTIYEPRSGSFPKLFTPCSSVDHQSQHYPYRSTVWQYSPKKYSEGPQVPSAPPPCCGFTQSSADENEPLSASLVLILSPALEKLRAFRGQGLTTLPLPPPPLPPPQAGGMRWRLTHRLTHRLIMQEWENKTRTLRTALFRRGSGEPGRFRSATCWIEATVLSKIIHTFGLQNGLGTPNFHIFYFAVTCMNLMK